LLLTIDVQNDFCLDAAPARLPGALEIVPAVRTVADAFRAAARPIVHVVRLYAADGGNADACRKSLIADGARIAAPGSAGADLVAELKIDPSKSMDSAALLRGDAQLVAPGEWLLYKSRWSAFHRTRLPSMVEDLGVDTVVVVGFNFPNCPRTTIFDASMRDLRILVVRDAVSGLYDRAIDELAAIGVSMIDADDVADWLAA
jgi:nicotinamidase-related amidase